MTDIIRVLRVIEYRGPRDLVEKQLENCVTGTRTGVSEPGDHDRRVLISGATVGAHPEVLGDVERGLFYEKALDEYVKEPRKPSIHERAGYREPGLGYDPNYEKPLSSPGDPDDEIPF